MEIMKLQEFAKIPVCLLARRWFIRISNVAPNLVWIQEVVGWYSEREIGFSELFHYFTPILNSEQSKLKMDAIIIQHLWLKKTV
jgi:hypothetical protein